MRSAISKGKKIKLRPQSWTDILPVKLAIFWSTGKKKVNRKRREWVS